MSDPFDFANEDVFPQSDRLQILSPEEYELLWGLPRFSEADRDLFFTLNQREEQTLGRLRTPRTKLHFLLQLGYFRARQRIFRLDVETVRDDLAYVSRRYLDGALIADLNISKHTRQQHLSLILALFGYRMIDQRIRLTLEERALVAARISSRPVYVLRDLIDHLRHQRVVLPGYTHLQDVVRRALSFERQRLSEALDQFITPDDEVMLDALLSGDDGLHAVTSIKHHPRDFSHKQLLVEIERGHQIRELFFVARRVIAQAGLSAESVRFYASLVDYYTVYKLKRMTPAMTRLYLLCFVHDRYQRLNDHLLAALCALIRRFSDEVAIAAKESVYRYKIQANDDLGQGVKILQLFLDPAIDDQTLFIDVRVRAQDLLTVDRLERLCQHLTGDAGGFDEAVYEWQAIDAIMPKVKRNMRPLLRFLSLSGAASTRTLLTTLEGLADAFRSGLQLPATHSTDTHGANQVNFALLHLFGYRFAPRYRDFRSKIQAGLYGFKHPNAYGHYPLKPIRRIRENLIVSEWPNIERILLSLALKTTTQSVIVSKLSTYRRQNRTKNALWEFDNIIKSLYLLDYVDSPILRRNVHKALNRGEAYHRLRRAIAYAHGGRFRVRSQQEQDLWNECARLIANAVVHYNSIVLSEVMQTLENRSNKAASEALKRISPLAWQHVNFYGRYRFDSDLLPIDIAAMASQLAGTGANLWLDTA